jgi:hypothetical protein
VRLTTPSAVVLSTGYCGVSGSFDSIGAAMYIVVSPRFGCTAHNSASGHCNRGAGAGILGSFLWGLRLVSCGGRMRLPGSGVRLAMVLTRTVRGL